MRLALGLTVAALVLPLASCGGNTEATRTSDPSTPSESTRASDAASPTPPASAAEDPFAPNIGDRALKVGETRVGAAVETTLLEVKRPLRSGNPYQIPQSSGNEFVGLHVKACVNEDAEEPVTVGWDDWTISDKNSGRYRASSSSWDDFPSPQYPVYSALSPGQCASGFVLVAMPKRTAIDLVTLQAFGSEASAEWLLS